MEDRLLAARRAFAESPAGRKAARRRRVLRFSRKYNSAATLLDNILFGRVVYGQAQAETRIRSLLTEVLTDLHLRDSVIEVGLEYNVGVAGRRLPATQRQKLGIARALIKRPQFLIVNEAVAVFDGRTQDRMRDNILALAAKAAAACSGSPTGRARPSRSTGSWSCRPAESCSSGNARPSLSAKGGLYAEAHGIGVV
jgi:putative ABC transport system ATP-binding protein